MNGVIVVPSSFNPQQKSKMDARKRRAARAAMILVIVVLTAGCGWFGRASILEHVGSWWVISDKLEDADAIVVLEGDMDIRPFAAADLYHHGFSKTILVANVRLGRAELLGLVPSQTQMSCEILEKLGIPAAAIIPVGENVSNTHEEAQAVRAWAAKSGAKRIIVPTELFASRRTRWVFERELRPIGVDVIVQALPAADYTLANWWHYRYGLIDFNNELFEYMYYRIRY